MAHRLIVFVMIALAGVACAGTGAGGARHKPCDLLTRDSAFAASGPVFRDCAVDRAARLQTTSIHPDYRPTTTRSMCYSADVEFVVDSVGKPESQTAVVVRTNDQAFAESVVAMLNKLRYDPALREQMHVRQIVAMHQAMSTVVVLVKAGSSPPPPGMPPGSAPPC